MLHPLPLVACLLACALTIPVPAAEPANGTPAAAELTATTETAAILAVLREAEALGLPTLEEGATFWFEADFGTTGFPVGSFLMASS